jgi:hypothetical protein
MYRTAMPFGKYRGWLLGEIPASYLCWCLEECDSIRPDLRAAVREELADRFGRRPAPRRAGLDPVAFAAAVESIFRRLTLEFHPDRGGSTAAQQALNEFHERVRRVLAA